MQGRRIVCVLGAALAMLVVAASPATAAPTWLEPTPLSSPPRLGSGFVLGAGTPDVAFDGSGNVVATWQQLSEDASSAVVQVTTRAPEGSFSPAVDIGPTVLSGLGLTDPPRVEMDAAGTATLAFTSDDKRIKVATRPPGGSFSSPPEELSTGTGNDNVDLAASAAGHVIVGWQDAANHIWVTTRPPGGGFAPATDLGLGGTNLLTPQVAINDQGAAVAAWIESDGANTIIRARVRTAGTTFATATEQLLSAATQNATSPDVAIDAQGRATAIWQRSDGTNQIIQSKQSDTDGQFPAAVDPVSNTGSNGASPQVVVDAENTAVAAWTSGSTVMAASRPSNASFGDPQPISAPDVNTAVPPRLAVDPSGNVLAVWAPSGADESVRAARRPKGGAFGGVELIPRGAAKFVWGPAVAFDDQGNALALWSGQDSANKWTVNGSAFDVAPPTLSAIAVPGTGTAGQGVGMAAAATDRWSPVSISWSFGDGGTASGGAVTHAFGSAGAFTVTATATDAVGNASNATRSILVSPAPPPPPPPPKKRITSPVGITWALRGKQISLVRLLVQRAPKGSKAQLRCSGKKCPFKRVSSKKRRKGTIALFKAVKPTKALATKKRNFRGGQRLELRITAKGYIGKVVRYKLKTGKIPVGKQRCLPIGAKKPRKRC
jgi:hypothetical protein